MASLSPLTAGRRGRRFPGNRMSGSEEVEIASRVIERLGVGRTRTVSTESLLHVGKLDEAEGDGRIHLPVGRHGGGDVLDELGKARVF